MSSFVPEGAAVPPGLQTEIFSLRKLTINDVVKDFDAVVTSAERLKGVFGPDSTWPDGLTLEQDLVDLGWHQKEFENQSSFAYTMMSPDESECLGCVYIYPSPNQVYDAQVILWVRQSESQTGLDEALFDQVKNWLATDWWIKKPGFPGRDISWQEWLSLPAI